jgi:hypothetical protein
LGDDVDLSDSIEFIFFNPFTDHMVSKRIRH